jgi:hypothetical protein
LGRLSDEAGDLGEVVGEDAVSGPGSSAGEGVHLGSSAAVVAFDAVDASFGAGAPSDHALEASGVFGGAACLAGSSFAGDAHLGDAELTEVGFDGGFAIAAIRGDGSRGAPGESLDPFDCWDKLGRVGGVADLDGPVEDDTVGVVDDLGFDPPIDVKAVDPDISRAVSFNWVDGLVLWGVCRRCRFGERRCPRFLSFLTLDR